MRAQARANTREAGGAWAGLTLLLLAALSAGCGTDPCDGVVCETGLVCVDGACVGDGVTPGTCAADADCAGLVNRSHCLVAEGRCVQCTSAAHCPDPEGQVCTTDGWTCRARPPCGSDADCADLPATPRCEVGTGTCVACLSDAHCAGGQQVCVEGRCRFDPCASDADCAAVPGAPFCNVLTGECAVCLTDAHCDGEARCRGGVCAPPGDCDVDADCPAGTVCDTRRLVPECVPCARSADCRLGGVCASGTCSPAFACDADGDCGGLLRCDGGGTCVECVSEADCAAGQACGEDGRCLSPPSCGPGALCRAREVCEAQSCTLSAACAPDGYEWNDAPYEAAVLPDGPVDAVLCPNEWDWYVLRADPADGLVVDAAYASPDGAAPDLVVWAGDGSGPVPLAPAVDTPDGRRVTVTTLSWPPPYWIGLRGVNAPLPYRLEVDAVPGGLCDDDAREPDDTPGSAAAVTVPADETVVVEGRACAGDPDWLRVVVPGGRRLAAELDAPEGVGVTAFVPGEDGEPVPATEEGRAAAPPPVDADTVHWLRVRADASASYRLSLRLRPPRPEGDLCAAPRPLSPGAAVEATTAGASDDGASACGGAGAPDVAFAFTLAEAARVDAVAEGALDPVLSLRARCDDAATEVACADRAGPSESVAAVLPAGDWILWVDGYGTREGAVSVSLAARPPPPRPPENGCAGGASLEAAAGGGVVAAELAGAYDTLSAGCGLPGADAAWTLTLDTAASLTARLEAPAGASLSVRAACDAPASEEACAVTAPGDPDAAELFVPRLSAGTWTLVVDGVPVDDAAVDLTWALGSPVPTPGNDGCAAPEVLDLSAGPVTVAGDTRAARDDLSPSCAAGAGRDVFYAFDLAAPAAVSARLDAAFEGVLALDAACPGAGARVCSAAVPPAFFEPALPAGRWVLAVDAYDGGAGSFDLTVEAAPPRPVPANDACAGALPLAVEGGPVAGSTWRASDDLDPGPGCTGSPAPGPDTFHVLDLAAGETVAVTATPAEGYDLALYLVDGCGAPACLAGADDSFVSGPETVVWTASAAGPVYVVVDAWAAEAAGDYVLEARRVE